MRLRPPAVRDLRAVQALLAADPGYAQRVTGEEPAPGSATDVLLDRPRDLHPDRKVVLGGIDDHGSAAVIDVLRGWSEASIAHIGLLQVHASRKKQGIGRSAHGLLLEWTEWTWPEIRTLRAAIVATNAEDADPFWTGYQSAESPKPYRAGAIVISVTGWKRPVAAFEAGTS